MGVLYCSSSANNGFGGCFSVPWAIPGPSYFPLHPFDEQRELLPVLRDI